MFFILIHGSHLITIGMHFSTQTKIKQIEVKTTHKGPSQKGKKCLRALWSFNYWKKLKKFFRSLISLSYWINGFCLGFVIWQTIKCMTKYIEKPKGTEINMKESANLPFPAITVCGSFGKDGSGNYWGGHWGFNFTYLQNVCGISAASTYFRGQWANSKCSDPKELFEAVIFRPEDVIENIYLTYWTKLDKYWTKIDNFTDLYEDSYYGRCVNLVPSNEHIQYGIKSIKLYLQAKSTVYIHTPGMLSLSKGNQQSISKINVELGKQYIYGVHYEFHELLDYGGSPCNNDKTYQMDACNYDGPEKLSLEEHGCTTPFGPNKNKICTNATLGSSVFWTQYYRFMFIENYEGCNYPCSYFTISTKHESTLECSPVSSILDLNFEQLIQVTKSHYTYSELSLIAEIGGYVGLFLGISVNQMPYLLHGLAKVRSLF